MTPETETPTPDPTTTLAAWRAVTEGATEATRGLPWVVDPDEPYTVLASKNGGFDGMTVAVAWSDSDAEAVPIAASIVSAHRAFPALLDAVESVLGLMSGPKMAADDECSITRDDLRDALTEHLERLL